VSTVILSLLLLCVRNFCHQWLNYPLADYIQQALEQWCYCFFSVFGVTRGFVIIAWNELWFAVTKAGVNFKLPPVWIWLMKLSKTVTSHDATRQFPLHQQQWIYYKLNTAKWGHCIQPKNFKRLAVSEEMFIPYIFYDICLLSKTRYILLPVGSSAYLCFLLWNTVTKKCLEDRLFIFRLKSESNCSEKTPDKYEHFLDDALKTWDNKCTNVEPQ